MVEIMQSLLFGGFVVNHVAGIGFVLHEETICPGHGIGFCFGFSTDIMYIKLWSRKLPLIHSVKVPIGG